MKYLDYLPKTISSQTLLREIEQKQRWVSQNKKGFLRYRNPYTFLTEFKAKHIDCSGEVIHIGHKDEIADDVRTNIRKNLRAFMPWRKGPFHVFGIDIDAEWRSERKWQRLLPRLPDLKDTIVADIGCSNGYYMFRMAYHQPKMVLGFEPSVQHYYCFEALNSMAGFSLLFIDLLGVEHIHLFPQCFDVIFLMGVIYHRSSPVETLRDIYSALRPGGTIILESQGIPGDEPYALFPEATYAKVPGTYFVPTGNCLINWLKRAGFGDCELFCNHPMSSAEQRQTEWMVFESYSDFIDPEDSEKTIEGYPAPCRLFLTGKK